MLEYYNHHNNNNNSKDTAWGWVHINAHESFLSSSSVNDSDFVESLQNGFVQLATWKEYNNS